MENNIYIESSHLDVLSYEGALKKFIEKVIKYLKPEFPLEISVSITNNEEIQEINKEQRDIDKPTDVLSFPMLFWQQPEILENPLSDCDYNMETGLVYLGDLVISIEKIREQAEEYEHSFERELYYLTIHGILHLFGYDHIEENDKKIMRQKEEEIYSTVL